VFHEETHCQDSSSKIAAAERDSCKDQPSNEGDDLYTSEQYYTFECLTHVTSLAEFRFDLVVPQYDKFFDPVSPRLSHEDSGDDSTEKPYDVHGCTY
jgi:hypothetical protein